MNQQENEIYCLARPYLNIRNNEVHTKVALSYALWLMRRVKGERKIVAPAIILHDTGWIKVSRDTLDKWSNDPTNKEFARFHEIESVKIAQDILKRTSYDKSLVDDILFIVDIHDTGGEPGSLNEIIVRDADKLWRYSRTAIILEAKIFKMTFEERLELLSSELENWFFLAESRNLAKQQLERRKCQMGLKKYYANYNG